MNSQSRMYDVGGVLLARPFKARRLGHFALWQTDLDMARRLYVDVLGFRHTDTVQRDEVFRSTPANRAWFRFRVTSPEPA